MSSHGNTPNDSGSNGPGRNTNPLDRDRAPSSSPPPTASPPTFAGPQAASILSPAPLQADPVPPFAEALAYVAAQAERASAGEADRGRTYTEAHGDTYGSNATAAMGSGWRRHPPPTSDPNGRGRTTRTDGQYRSYGPPGTAALRSGADLTTSAQRQGQNPNGPVPGGGNRYGSGRFISGFAGGVDGPYGPNRGDASDWRWRADLPETSYGRGPVATERRTGTSYGGQQNGGNEYYRNGGPNSNANGGQQNGDHGYVRSGSQNSNGSQSTSGTDEGSAS
ncbi:hypothetical protein CSHISOI_05211 [Colletotrichum shisoi]|uniref:Uncharacterized protein n=1 Tax=Colletotrichum shisoi TaxID=2078593 RepID=A0A5Q4BU25_9PEZI|nr:hypothetical protein CSHISOI_05211 [Colletotrichum shisoi]